MLLEREDIKEQMAKIGARTDYGTPQQYSDFVQAETTKFGEIIKREGLQMDAGCRRHSRISGQDDLLIFLTLASVASIDSRQFQDGLGQQFGGLLLVLRLGGAERIVPGG